MATNFASNIATNQIAVRQAKVSFEHRFFLTVAVLFPLITVIGFAPTYFFKTAFNTPPLPSLLVHAHGMAMSLWIVLFSVQAYLISSKRVKLHMTLGIFGVALAIAMVVLGVMTGYAAAARGAGFPGYTPIEFFIVPIGDMLTFAILFAAAIYYRKDAATHKRLMLVTVINFLPPSIARPTLNFFPELGTIWFFGVPAVIGISLLALDTYRTGKLNRAFAASVALMALSGPIRMFVARTDAWTNFATWVLA